MSYAAGIAVIISFLSLGALVILGLRLFGQVKGLGRTVASASARIAAASSSPADTSAEASRTNVG